MAWLAEQEEYLKNCGPVADTYDNLVAQLEEHKVGEVELRGCSLFDSFLVLETFKRCTASSKLAKVQQLNCPMVSTLIIFVFHVKIMLFL